MAKVSLALEAQRDFLDLPLPIQHRVRAVFLRLADWPAISGAKPLRGSLKGCFRIRTGSWRVIVRPAADVVLVLRIDNRRDVYED